MKYILNSTQMQQCDANTMDGFGIPSAVLMERASLSVVREITAVCTDSSARVLVACGVGNNGGDGIAVARLLERMGYAVTILFPGDEEKCSVECARQLGIARQYGIGITKEMPKTDFDVIVDAIFGIGLTREITGNLRDIIEALNAKDGWKVAVDISSGISADTGKIMGIAFDADLTVTFGFAKVGHLLYPGAGYTGRLAVEEIGIDEMSLPAEMTAARMAEPQDIELLPVRPDDSNKGTYGKLLIFAGSYNMAGAASFSAKAAYRTGAGLVRVATDTENREIIQTLVPEAILSTYDAKTDMELFVRDQIGWADAVVLGPGIGRSRQAEEMVHSVLKAVRVPCLVDADGLNILSEHMEWLGEAQTEIVITPHPGEMTRLLKLSSVAQLKSDMPELVRNFTDRCGTVTVLKDARTLICTPGGDTWINTTGNNGMATAGSGDVLTGIIGALLGQNVRPELAAVLGVMIHGMAGDAAAERVGRTSLMATDIVESISDIFRRRDVTE